MLFVFIGSTCLGQTSNDNIDFRNLSFNSQYEAVLLTDYLQHHPVNFLELFLAPSVVDNAESVKAYVQEFNTFVEMLKKKQKRYRTENQFLTFLFYRTHNKFLKHYEQYVTLTDLFEKGKYDCLTGTAFYTLLLDQLGYHYQIIETNYHALLLIDTPEGQYLFESTDFASGFLSDPLDIRERLDYYHNLSADRSEDGNYYNFKHTQNYVIGLPEMVGLQYYNQAIKFYNQQQPQRANEYLEKALIFYQSPRIREFRKIVRSTLQSNQPLSMNY